MRNGRHIRALFGGALFCAGMTPGAQAQNFGHMRARADMQAELVIGYTFVYHQDIGGVLGLGSVSYEMAAWVGEIVADPERIGVAQSLPSTSTAFAFAGVSVASNVYALSDMTVRVEWDFAGWTGDAYVLNITQGTTPFTDHVSGPVGTETFDLAKGDYCVFVGVLQGSAGGDDGFINFTIQNEPDCPADLDGNGVLNFDDIDLFVAGFLEGC